MKILKKKYVAMLIMSLAILASLVLTAKAPVLKALTVLLVFLVVCNVIDWIVENDHFAEKKRKLATVLVGVVAIVGIGIWGVFTDASNLEYAVRSDRALLTSTANGKQIDEAYELGQFYYEKGEFEQAIKMLREVSENSDDYVEAQKLLMDAVIGYRASLMVIAGAYVERSDYTLAINILSSGLDVIPDDSELTRAIEDYSLEYTDTIRTEAITKAEAYAMEQNYADALITIQNTIADIGSDAELSALSDSYMTSYKEDILMQADASLNTDGYLRAIEIVKDGLKIIPSDEDFAAAVELYESYEPISLDSLEIWQYGRFTCGPYTFETEVDNYGNTYDSFYSGGGENYNVYKIDENYSTLSGVFCMKKQYNSRNDESSLYIYGDDVLLGKYKTTGGKEPLEFSVDISGVSLLKIQPVSQRGLGGEEISFVANLYLIR